MKNKIKVVWTVADFVERKDVAIFFEEHDAVSFARARNGVKSPRVQVERSLLIAGRVV